MPVTTESSPFALHTPLPAVSGDLTALHAREVDRLVAYLGCSDRGAGPREAEDIAALAFLEVASAWPGTAGFSRPEVFLFASAQRIAVTRAYGGRSGLREALGESASGFWDRGDLARLTILQDALDQLPEVPRYGVLLREMCGFSPAESAEIIGVSAAAVDDARGDALRSLVPAVEARTSGTGARPGPLSPGDFAALSRVLQNEDRDVVAARRQFAHRLAAPARPQPLSPVSAAGGWSGSPSWSAGSEIPPGGANGWSSGSDAGWAGASSTAGRTPQTPLDAPLSAVDLSSNVGTPIFDAISAWFASGPTAGSASSWSALDDGGWRAAEARAAAEPQVAGLSESGLPLRARGANMVPSATELTAAARSMFGEPQPVDPGQVRRRIDSFQQGVKAARRMRRQTDQPPQPPGAAVSAPEPLPTPPVRPDPPDFNAFYRENLPQLLADLMVGGALPAVAAELAQGAMAEAYRVWADLEAPRDWVHARALAALAARDRPGS